MIKTYRDKRHKYYVISQFYDDNEIHYVVKKWNKYSQSWVYLVERRSEVSYRVAQELYYNVEYFKEV